MMSVKSVYTLVSTVFISRQLKNNTSIIQISLVIGSACLLCYTLFSEILLLFAALVVVLSSLSVFYHAVGRKKSPSQVYANIL